MFVDTFHSLQLPIMENLCDEGLEAGLSCHHMLTNYETSCTHNSF